jgi:ribosomal protein S18 acetylase RimI-like enzyme
MSSGRLPHNGTVKEQQSVPDVRLQRYGPQDARALRETIASVHRDAYADAIASGDPFEFHVAFMQRFDNHARHPELDLVMAYAGSDPVGQTWGFPIAKPTIDDRPRQLAQGNKPSSGQEDDARTFALCEIMVRKAWTGQGIAHTLHDELLRARPEQLAELYVRPENTRAYRAYLKWAWCKVGETRPNLPDAPLFDVLVLPLPLSR